MVTKEQAIVSGRNSWLTVAFLLITSALFLPWSCALSRKPLLLGQLLQRELSAGASHQLDLTLNAGQYAHILLTPVVGRIKGMLYDPQKQLLATIFCFENEPGGLSIVATESGVFHLTVHSLEYLPGKTSYTLKWDEARTIVDQDKSRIAAEIAFAEAEQLRTEWKAEQTRNAIQKYSEAKDLWQGINEHRNVAKAYRKMGGAFLSLGELAAARANYEQAYNISHANEDEEFVAYTLNDWCDLDLRADEPEEAHKKATEIFGIGQRRNNAQIIALATAHLNQVESYRTPMKTVSSYEKLLQFWSASGNVQQQAEIYQKLGIAYYYASEFTKAISVYEQSQQLSRAIGDQYKEARALIYQGNAYSVIGEKQQALSCYEKARLLIKQMGDGLAEARLKAGLGYVFDSLGNQAQALSYRQESQQLFHLLGARGEEATALMYVGELNNSLGNSQIALASFEQALQLFRELKDHRMICHALRNIGRVFDSQGHNDQALRKYNQALQMSLPGTDERWKAYVYLDIGRLLQHNRQYPQASRHYRQALAFNRKTDDKIGEAQTHYYLAKLSLDQRNLPEAEAQIKQAAFMTESVRAKVFRQELRTSYFASVNEIYELYLDVLMQRYGENPQDDLVAEALRISERARARSLLDLLNDSRQDIKQGADPKLLEQERLLLQTLNGKAERKMRLAGNKEKEPELAILNQELDSLNAQVDELRTKLRETSPRYAALTQPQPLNASEIQQMLDDNTLLLEYALGEDRSYVWAVTKDSLEVFTLPKRAVIEQLSGEVYALMTAPQPQPTDTPQSALLRIQQAAQRYWPKAAQLSDMLLAPLAAKLGNKRLIVVSEGALQRIPFAALPAPGRREGEKERKGDDPTDLSPRLPVSPSSFLPLVVAHEIISLPSASILSVLRKERATSPAAPTQFTSLMDSFWGIFGKRPAPPPAGLDSVAILADPVFEKDDRRILAGAQVPAAAAASQTRDVDLSDENLRLNRLPETARAAGEIEKAAGATAFLCKTGFAVNRALLASEELQRYAIVHFATHGYWDSERPELSGLVLSRYDPHGNKQDGFLHLSDIYNLRMPKELVVLSACETALGKDIRGEGLMALTRGFMYAGAARVIASLWKVEESATVDLMKIFYGKLLREKLSPAAALRAAQLAMWQQDPNSLPYEWAAFVLQGEFR